ncbi:hypothetical protein LCGC14_0377730 [marine sediment metagenome]|uniref:Cyclic-phosphate processing Receiver domain-containing protein n=1 Tax=marine sediment metagenome TaxID=412755 RepID=A0A0F9VQC0_9ZZZZ
MANKRPIHIFLDDERRAPYGVIQTNTVEDTIELLKAFHSQNICVASLSLDHDLGYHDDDGREMTGYEVMIWIERAVFNRQYLPPKEIFCHSANYPGRIRIEAVIAVVKLYVGADSTKP